MTFDKVIEVARMYRERLAREEPGSHLISMVDRMEEWGPERIEKAMRWLGFLQGALWCSGYYTIEEMKKHNMPEEDGP